MSQSLSDDRAAIADEMGELKALAGAMLGLAPQLDHTISRAQAGAEAALGRANTPYDAEEILEAHTRALRHLWLAAAAASTTRSYRSPTTEDHVQTPGGHEQDFGYERDLRPEALERRCASFFPRPACPWRADHILFSSGQAAMTASLLLLGRAIPSARLAHFGRYFETNDLVDLMPNMSKAVPGSHNIAIIEPVWCDGGFGLSDIDACVGRTAGAIIIDGTLTGLRTPTLHILDSLQGSDTLVLQIHSGLKLFQAGLELADVGILSVYAKATNKIGDDLRTIRTLTGSGLRFADIGALELPMFLDPVSTERYESAIFAHNAALAVAVMDGNKLFAPAVHPVLQNPDAPAPYCVFQIRDDDEKTYEKLEATLCAESKQRGLHFDRGGSFGFRGHRFEVVRPNAKPPFLRVAMGRRPGWSQRGILQLMKEIAQG